MKAIILLTILPVLFTVNVCGQAEPGPYDWLIGAWENQETKPGETAREIWTRDADGDLIGTGFTMRGKDTVFVEQLRILRKEGQYYYSANVSHNAGPVLFRIVETGTTGFISENPAHNFPKVIAYSLENDVMTATIGDDQKEIPFKFKRIKN